MFNKICLKNVPKLPLQKMIKKNTFYEKKTCKIFKIFLLVNYLQSPQKKNNSNDIWQTIMKLQLIGFILTVTILLNPNSRGLFEGVF